MARSGQGGQPVKTHASDHRTAELRISAVPDARELAGGWRVAGKDSGPSPTTDHPPADRPSDSPFAQREDLVLRTDQPWHATERPNLRSPAVPNPQESVKTPGDCNRPTVLVVDDERDVLRSIHDLLRLDYRVVTCQQGAEALAILRSAEPVHVILSDQKMPEMTGVEVLRLAKVIRPETTRLLFTAYADIRTVVDAVNEGHIFRYLAKPWLPEELEAAVRQAVEHHDLIVEKNRLVAELQQTNARLLEANRLKGAFIEVASHELNTPVTVVLGMIELWKMSQAEMPRRRNANGLIESARRRNVWLGRSSVCSNWFAIESSVTHSTSSPSKSSPS